MARPGRRSEDQRRQFGDGGDHGERGALDRNEGLVHIYAHRVGRREEGYRVGVGVGWREDGANGLCEEFLRVACAEVETYRFEDEAF